MIDISSVVLRSRVLYSARSAGALPEGHEQRSSDSLAPLDTLSGRYQFCLPSHMPLPHSDWHRTALLCPQQALALCTVHTTQFILLDSVSFYLLYFIYESYCNQKCKYSWYTSMGRGHLAVISSTHIVNKAGLMRITDQRSQATTG